MALISGLRAQRPMESCAQSPALDVFGSCSWVPWGVFMKCLENFRRSVQVALLPWELKPKLSLTAAGWL